MGTLTFDKILNYAAVVGLARRKTGDRLVVCGTLIKSAVPTSGATCVIGVGKVADSSDSETRSACFSQQSFNALVDHRMWSIVEPHFLTLVDDLTIDTTFYFPETTSSNTRKSFKTWFFNARYDFKIAMVNTYFLAENVARRAYMNTWLDEKITPMRLMVQAVEDATQPFAFTTTARTLFPREVDYLKIIPLTANEIQHISDIRYAAWRCVYIQTRVFEMRATRICEFFSAYRDWFLVHDVDSDMFMNPNILRKFAKDHALREIRTAESTILADDGEPLLDPQITFAVGNIKQSGIALCGVHPALVRPIIKFQSHEPDIIRGLIFGWVYSLLVLHQRVGAIHADIQTGNLYFIDHQTPISVIIDGFIHNSKTRTMGALLDFSRSIINPYMRDNSAHTQASVETIASEQGRLLMIYFDTTYPKDEHGLREKVDKLISADFNVAFCVLSLLDAIHVAYQVKLRCTNIKQEEVAIAFNNLCEGAFHEQLTGTVDEIIARTKERSTAYHAKVGIREEILDFPLRDILFRFSEFIPIEEGKSRAISTNTFRAESGVVEYPQLSSMDAQNLMAILAAKK